MGKPAFKAHVDGVRKLIKNKGSVSLAALGYELSMSPGYTMRIAQTACEIDPELLMRRPYIYEQGRNVWVLFTKKGFEEYQAKREAEEANRLEEAMKARAVLVSKSTRSPSE